MLTFDYIKSTRKLHIKSDDSDLYDRIREHFSVENDGARFARRYKRYAARRKYAISNLGACELGLYWEIRQYLIKNQIQTDIDVTNNLKEVLDNGINDTVYTDFKFKLREYQEEVIGKALRLGMGTCVLGTGAGKTFTTAALIENFFRKAPDKDTFKCLMLVPDLGLVQQTYDEFINCGTTYKITKWTGKNKPDLTANVIIANIGIIQSRFEENDWLKYVDLLIVDECVKPGTKVSTQDGEKAIEDIQVGDMVASYNKDTQVIEYKPVVRTLKNQNNLPYVKITTECGKELNVTTNHEVYTENRGYVEAGDLTKEDILLFI